LRGKQIRRFHLTTNYRNSAEIFDFAAAVVRRVVPDADIPQAVRQTGVEPTRRTVAPTDLPSTVAASVDELRTRVEGTIGVVTPTGRRASVASLLSGQLRVQVVDAMQAKGMEYDGVVVVAPDEIAAESASGVRVLYVALTRATHRLVTVATDDAWSGVTES
jgi:DNA helicase IV